MEWGEQRRVVRGLSVELAQLPPGGLGGLGTQEAQGPESRLTPLGAWPGVSCHIS